MRTDKANPNDQRVVASVKKSIDDGITFDELKLEFIARRRSGKPGVADSCVLPSYYTESVEATEKENLAAEDFASASTPKPKRTADDDEISSDGQQPRKFQKTTAL
eukprot:GHVT01059275.1.p2 GENE.GHVT01059275.1~~GHVT01059275.1.p2  ORF type:complete len:106 (-),score=21.75 GHVT01059275.1:541-858(-)